MTSQETQPNIPNPCESLLRQRINLLREGSNHCDRTTCEALIKSFYTFKALESSIEWNNMFETYVLALCNVLGYCKEELEVLEGYEVGILYWDNIPINE